jgi:hypothetical protein
LNQRTSAQNARRFSAIDPDQGRQLPRTKDWTMMAELSSDYRVRQAAHNT